MLITIQKPKELEEALDRMSRTLATELPQSIKGWMVAVPAFAILRSIYGGPYRAIWELLKWQVRASWR